MLEKEINYKLLNLLCKNANIILNFLNKHKYYIMQLIILQIK